jgi:predicted nucleotide-binding protein
MIERFRDSTVLREALTEQRLIAGDVELIDELMSNPSPIELCELVRDEVLIKEGSGDNDLFLILAGNFDILVRGRRIATRRPGEVVGEMAATLPHMKRSASVQAAETSVVAKITSSDLERLGSRHPQIWRQIAKIVTDRLYQRNSLLNAPNSRSRLFVICSKEGLSAAQALQEAFQYDNFSVTLWTDGVFRASGYPVPSLVRQLDLSDFAVAILSPDDTRISRETSAVVPRDNVLFELGMFIGRLGQHRSFLMEPRDADITLPSDLTGITTIPYRSGPPEEMLSLVGPACNALRRIINEIGPK